jgi:hypothetical protein
MWKRRRTSFVFIKLIKLNHRTRCSCFGATAFACVNTIQYIRSSVSCSLDIYVLRGHLINYTHQLYGQHVLARSLCAFVKGVIYKLRCEVLL